MNPQPSYWLVTIKSGFRIIRRGMKITPMQANMTIDEEYVRGVVMQHQAAPLRGGGYAMPRGIIMSIEPRDPAKPVVREIPLGSWMGGRFLKLPKLAMSPADHYRDKAFLKEFDGLRWTRPGASVGV